MSAAVPGEELASPSAATSPSPPATTGTLHVDTSTAPVSPSQQLSSPASTEPVKSPSPASPTSPSNTNSNAPPAPVYKGWRNWHSHLPPIVQRIFRSIASFMDGAIVLLIIVIATLVTIFLDDIRVNNFGPGADYTFAVITFFFLALFLLELFINCIVKPEYFLSGFFVMDVVSAFSLLPDIYWIWNPMIGLKNSDTTDDNNSDPTLEVERIKRVSSTGARLLKVLKFVKLIRLGRIAKLFEMAQRTLKERARQKRREERKDDGNIYADDYTQSSQVGQTLSEQTIRNVVLLVLLMLFGIPLLQPITEENVEGFVVNELNAVANSPATLEAVYATQDPVSGVYTAILPSQAIALNSSGTPVTLFAPLDLATLLVAYDSTVGQKPDKTVLSSTVINETYVASVVPATHVSVAMAALTQARGFLDMHFDWVTQYYSETLVYMRIRAKYYTNDYETQTLFELRTSDMRATAADQSAVVFNIRKVTQQAAWYSIWRTFTTLLLLFIGAIAFDYNNKRMVIVPIERMVSTIVQLQKNPLAKAIMDDENGDAATNSQNDKLNETGMLERTLQKLTGLLQVGFGDAGSRMIQKCMQQNAEGDLDPLVDGTRMLAIFGFCDIRRFTDATECLREDVMMYVNEIASIVHSHVSVCDGHPNKNVGDAFLVMWRLAPHEIDFDPDDLFQLNEVQPTYLRPTLETIEKRKTLASQAERDYADQIQREVDEKLLFERAKQASASFPPIVRTITPLAVAQLSVLADKAVVSFLRIIIDLDASEELRTYENHPRIKAAFDDFIVQLGFGLHCGWSIEGPIGSRYKIDASYLSPHVNISEALQDLTKLYGTPLLVSGEFYTLLSPYLKSYMRRVDVVKVSGRDIPMNLYAFDIHPRAMRTMIARQVPPEYDTEADIEVLELKSSHFKRYRPVPPQPTSPVAAADGSTMPSDEPMSPMSPLSPQSPHDPHQDPLTNHRLFNNPYLNPCSTEFSNFNYSSADRERIHQSSPVATHHLVYNFRLSALQCGIPYAFHDVYESGLEAYLTGDWPKAKSQMDECKRLYPEDVPTQVILDVMKEHNFVAPKEWPGWHEA